MRSALIIGLTLLTMARAGGADKPIPQDPARTEQRRRELLEWNLKTTRGAYDAVGKKDPRWDEPARRAMELASRMFSQQIDPAITPEEVYAAARSAVDAGCNDPMLLYFYHRFSVGAHFPGEEEAILRMSATYPFTGRGLTQFSDGRCITTPTRRA